MLLLAKAAKNIRFASIGTKLGYYGGAYAVIRSALEALSYAALFENNAEEINKSFIYEFSERLDDELNRARNDQLKRAKKALLDLENDRQAIKDGLSEFLQKANPFIHTNLEGLAEEFGFDVGYLLPDDFQEEFEKAEGDFQRALGRYKLLNKFGTNILKSQSEENPPEDEILPIELAGRYDKPIMEHLSLFCFFIAHRILDTTKQIFEIKNEEFIENYKNWHKQVKDG